MTVASHIARQGPDRGVWHSKLGSYEDIEHLHPRDVESDQNGTYELLMQCGVEHPPPRPEALTIIERDEREKLRTSSRPSLVQGLLATGYLLDPERRLHLRPVPYVLTLVASGMPAQRNRSESRQRRAGPRAPILRGRDALFPTCDTNHQHGAS